MNDVILFITDTHLCEGTPGFSQQPSRPDLLPEIMDGVKRLAAGHKADLIVHGGDLVERSRPDRIENACAMLDGLGCPVAACLGNHDLAAAESCEWWKASTKGTAVQLANAVVSLNCVDVILLNTTWMHSGRPGYFWDPSGGKPVEAWAKESLAWLAGELSGADRTAILVMHAPIEPLPTRLTHLDNPIHEPQERYAADLTALLDKHPRVKAVLSGHNHATSVARSWGRVHINTSAVVEAPFECRLIECAPASLVVQTVETIPLPDDAEYLGDKSWVNGQPYDRQIKLVWD